MPASLQGYKSPNLAHSSLPQGGATVEQVGPVPRSDTLVEMLSRLSRRLVVTHSLDNDLLLTEPTTATPSSSLSLRERESPVDGASSRRLTGSFHSIYAKLPWKTRASANLLYFHHSTYTMVAFTVCYGEKPPLAT